MAKKVGWSFTVETNVEVQQDKLNKASKILEAFYDKYEDRSLKVDTSDLIKSVKQGVAVIKNLYEDGTKDATSWLNIRPQMKEQMEGILSDANKMFSDINVQFNNGMRVSGLADIMQGFDDQLGIAFADINGAYDELIAKQRELANSLDYNEIDDYTSQTDIRNHIDLLRELIQVQDEMASMNPSLSTEDLVGGYSSKSLQNTLHYYKEVLDEMAKYKLQTYGQYEKHRQIFFGLEGDYTKEKHENNKYWEEYDEGIEALEQYIKNRKNAIEKLREYEDQLPESYGVPKYIDKANEDIQRYEEYLSELKHLRGDEAPIVDGGVVSGNLSEVVEELGKIEQAIRDVLVAFQPLTDALGSEDSAISKFVSASVEDLNKLQAAFKETFADIKALSQKDFNVTNMISGGSNANSDIEQIRQLRKEAKATFDQVEELYNESLITGSAIKQTPQGVRQFLEFSGMMSTFDKADLSKRIKARSATSLAVVIDELNEWKKIMLQFNELRNQVEAGSFDASKYSTTPTTTKNIGVSGATNTTTSVDNTSFDGDNILNKVKILSEQVQSELDTIRSKIEETFSFVTIDPNLDNITTITDNIYQKFVELQTKINALDFKIEVPAVLSQVDNKESVDKSASESSLELDNEADSMQKVGDNADSAASKKRKFAAANQEVESSAQDTISDLEEEAEAMDEVADKSTEAATKVANAWDKTTSVYGADGSEIYYSQEKTVNYSTRQETYKPNLETGELELDTVKFIDNFKKRADAAEKTATKIKNANADLQEFISQFDSKTNNMGKYLKGYDDLKKFKITKLDDIDKAVKLMTDLNTEYNKVTKSFRQGTKSMNPFVNAITGLDEMGDKITSAEISFLELNNAPKELSKNIDALRPLLDTLNSFIKVDDDGNKSITDIYGLAEAYGALNVALRKVNSSIKIQKKIESANKRDQKFSLDLDKQASILTKQQAQWEKNGQLTDELRQKINSMFDSLAEVANSTELTAWKAQWSILKNEVMETKYEIEAAKNAQKGSDAATKAERDSSGKYWNFAFKESVENLVTPQKRPELEQLKAYMLQEAASTKEEVVESYDSIMTIITNKNHALKKLMSAKGEDEQQYWQKEYSSWFGAWSNLDKNAISDFFENTSMQAILGADRIEKFNAALRESQALSAKQRDKETNEVAQNAQKEVQNLESAYKLQEKLYNLKKQLSKIDADSAKGQELTRKVNEAQEEYDASVKLLSVEENRIKVLEKQGQLEKELDTLKGEKQKQQTEAEAKEEEKNLESAKALQDKLYNAKKQLAKVDAGSAKGQELTRKVEELDAQYNAALRLLSVEENLAEVLGRQVKLDKELNKTRVSSQNSYGKTAYNREAKYFDTIEANERAFADIGLSDDFLAKIEKYKTSFKELQQLREKFASDPDAFNDVDLKNKFQDSALEVEKLRKEILAVFKESQKLADLSDADILGKTKIDTEQFADAKTAMINFAAEVTNGQFKFTGFNAAATEMYGTMQSASGAIQNVTVKLDEGTNSLYAYQTGANKVSSSWQKLKGELTSGIKSIASMYLGIHDIIRVFRQGFTYVKEIDLAMTELRKVTDETDATYANFLKTASNVSSVIGSTVSDFTDATAAFARLGYSINESAKMAETAIVYKNVADGLDTIEESTDSIISTMMAYGIAADDTMSIIDRFNAVGNNFAITSAGIGDAMQRSASALKEGGNTIDESIGLITAANSVIQNPEQVGTALKTLSLRIRGVKTELSEAGLETEGMAETTAQLQAKLLALTHGEVDILANADEFKSTTQILREMSAAWKDMTDMERAAALELIGGKRQAKRKNCLNVQKCA